MLSKSKSCSNVSGPACDSSTEYWLAHASIPIGDDPDGYATSNAIAVEGEVGVVVLLPHPGIPSSIGGIAFISNSSSVRRSCWLSQLDPPSHDANDGGAYPNDMLLSGPPANGTSPICALVRDGAVYGKLACMQ